jgi:hypothetical protein
MAFHSTQQDEKTSSCFESDALLVEVVQPPVDFLALFADHDVAARLRAGLDSNEVVLPALAHQWYVPLMSQVWWFDSCSSVSISSASSSSSVTVRRLHGSKMKTFPALFVVSF